MLITFSCQAYANVTLFGDIGKRLLKMMGYSGNAGAIPADSLPQVLERLRKAVATEKGSSTTKVGSNPDTDFGDEPISLANRALPLIELLTAAANDKCNVWWETK